jgi:hypothetical protein
LINGESLPHFWVIGVWKSLDTLQTICAVNFRCVSGRTEQGLGRAGIYEHMGRCVEGKQTPSGVVRGVRKIGVSVYLWVQKNECLSAKRSSVGFTVDTPKRWMFLLWRASMIAVASS